MMTFSKHQPKYPRAMLSLFYGLSIFFVSGVLTGQTAWADAHKPYFVVQGGDVGTSSGFYEMGDIADPDGCIKLGAISVASWNNNNSDASGYYGASIEGAGFTSDAFQEIVTALNSDKNLGSPATYLYPAGQPPYYLGFANTAQDIRPRYWYTGDSVPTIYDPPNVYGGDFGNLPCIPNNYDAITASMHTSPWLAGPDGTAIVDLSTLAGGNYTYTGTLIINDNSRGVNQPITSATTGGKPINIAVNGNVYIESDIKYRYIGPSDIPQLNIAVNGTSPPLQDGYINGPNASGNIYVQSDVTEIHGFYQAINSTPDATSAELVSFNTGTFATCATRSGSTITQTTDYNTCLGKLTIYGALDANTVLLERTSGDVNNVRPNTTNSENAAETFRYSPELWIPTIQCSSAMLGQCLSNSYASETSLPPVL